VTVFVTTHYMDEAEYCDRLGLIYRGELIALGTPADLKTRLMQDEVIEIQCERPQDAMAEVETVPGIQEVALFGKGLHAVTTSGQASITAVRDRLGAAGYRVTAVARITPSLEDVFVSLIEAYDRVHDPQQEVKA
jgi:ABC-2 type transport system ATP-binding protein